MIILLLALSCSAQPAQPFRIVNGRLDCYVPRLGGWVSETKPSIGTPLTEDSIKSGFLEGIYRSTTSAERVAIRMRRHKYEVIDVRTSAVIERLDSIGLQVYPGEHGWAERWDRYLVVGKREYFKIR